MFVNNNDMKKYGIMLSHLSRKKCKFFFFFFGITRKSDIYLAISFFSQLLQKKNVVRYTVRLDGIVLQELIQIKMIFMRL